MSACKTSHKLAPRHGYCLTDICHYAFVGGTRLLTSIGVEHHGLKAVPLSYVHDRVPFKYWRPDALRRTLSILISNRTFVRTSVSAWTGRCTCMGLADSTPSCLRPPASVFVDQAIPRSCPEEGALDARMQAVEEISPSHSLYVN